MSLLSWLIHKSPLAMTSAVLLSIGSGLCGSLITALVFSIGNWQGVFWDSITLCTLSGAAVAFRFLAQEIVTRLGCEALYEMNVNISTCVPRTSLRSIENFGVEKLLAIWNGDLARVSANIPIIITVCTNVTILLAAIAYLGFLSVVGMSAIIVMVLIGAVLHVMATKNAVVSMKSLASLRDALQIRGRRMTMGVKEMQLNSRLCADEMYGYEALAARVRHINISATRRFNVDECITQYVFYLMIVISLVVTHNGDYQHTGAFLITVIYLMGPLFTVVQAGRSIIEGDIAFNRLANLQRDLIPVHKTSNRNEYRGRTCVAEVSLRSILFAYQGKPPVRESALMIGPFNCDFRPGQITFITGGNGSGKSTLSKLITCLYEPDSGTIEVNRIPLADEDRTWYMEQISTVFQDYAILPTASTPYLQSQSDQFLWWLQRMDIACHVEFDGDEIVNAEELSFGQRKRLALILAIMEDRPILLLDEWAADQSPDFKQLFYTKLLPELRDRGKIIIIISHDSRYFSLADQVIVLERGLSPQAEDTVVTELG